MAGRCVSQRGMHAWWGHVQQGGVRGSRDGYCSGQYVSYWNAFLFGIIFAENCMKMKTIELKL